MNMKNLMILIILVLPLHLQAQDTLVDARNQLKVIADELDMNEKEAYQVLVKEQTVQAFRNLMILMTMFLAGLFFKKYIHKAQDDKEYIKSSSQYRDDKYEYKNKWIVLAVLSGSIFIATFVYNSVVLSDTFTGLFNPEYGALEQLNFLVKKSN